jgi:hypothetical protein
MRKREVYIANNTVKAADLIQVVLGHKPHVLLLLSLKSF